MSTATAFANRGWTPEEKAKLISLLDEGDRVLHDIKALKDGLKDTVAAVSEEYSIPKRALNKAIRVHHKGNLTDDKETIAEVEELLHVTGKDQ